MLLLTIAIWISPLQVIFGIGQRPAETGRRRTPYAQRPLTGREQRWVAEQTVKASLEEKIGQMIMAPVPARFMNLQGPEFGRLRELVLNVRVGGLVITSGNVYEAAILLNRLQELAKIPLLVGADLENGVGRLLDGGTLFPWNLAVGATGDPGRARIEAEAIAKEARAIGINMMFAPVADVSSSPDCPGSQLRSYGDEPSQVARFVSAFIEGAQRAGVIATVKYFPGAGNAREGSPVEFPLLEADRDSLERVELVPFRAAVAAGVGAVMAGHLRLPRFDPAPAPAIRAGQTAASGQEDAVAPGDVTRPATFPGKVLVGMLRERLGFGGLVVTDVLSHPAMMAQADPEEAAVLAVQAGADLLLAPVDPAAAIGAVRRAVERGGIPASRIDRSFERILAAKLRLGLPSDRFVEVYDIDEIVRSQLHVRAAIETTAASLTLLRDERMVIPITRERYKRALHVTVTDRGTAAEASAKPGDALTAGLRKSIDRVESRVLDWSMTGSDGDRVDLRPADFDVVIVSVYPWASSRPGSGEFSGPLRELIGESIRSAAKVMVISFGDPDLIQAFPDIPGYLCAYGDPPGAGMAEVAVAKALRGDVPIAGKLPVSIPRRFPSGSGLETTRPARQNTAQPPE
ncbi:MAG: glycoside hydrolase family 3 protein [Acidobacteria bacterium]|nr:glycoside hydrolase family 3 protein [Acidobacteriota bacterium]